MSLLLIGFWAKHGPTPEFSLGSNSVKILSETEHIIEDKFSIVHYNVQNNAYKLDLIESELRNFDVICITGIWLDG